jgi:hypothetical protein
MKTSVLIAPIKELAPLLFPSYATPEGIDFKNPLDEM